MTIVLHVDDLMITNLHDSNLEAFYQYLKTAYKETKIVRGRILDYVGMTFDFSSAGEVKITMENCVNEILAGCGVSKIASTPHHQFCLTSETVRRLARKRRSGFIVTLLSYCICLSEFDLSA